MSELITNGDFASSANDSTNPNDNQWYEYQAGIDNALPTESEFGVIGGMYNIGIAGTVSAGINFINTFITDFDVFDFAYFLLEDKLTVIIYPASQLEANYSYGNNPNLPVFFNVESNVDNAIALEDSKIYTLSYQITATHFDTDYYLNDWNVKVQLKPNQEFLDTISFDLYGTSFNVGYNQSHQVAYPATGDYQVSFVFTSTNAMINGSGRGSFARHKFEIDNVSLVEYTDHIGFPIITDIEGNGNNFINFNLLGNEQVLEVSEDPVDYIENVCYTIPNGWFIFGITLLISSIRKGHGANPDEIVADANGNYDLSEFLKNHIYASEEDTVPIFYQSEEQFLNTVNIAKNNNGAVYLPQFDFNGIGNLRQFEGYQIKNTSGSSVYLKYSGNMVFDTITNSTDVQYNLVSGATSQNNNFLIPSWNMVSLPSLEPIDCVAYFQEFVDLGVLLAVKRYDGTTYLPEWNFNGIGNLIPGEGYQVRLDF
tara:strand:+ start:658 stop:2106 length:1449 start_codon:yes stop_codon:yes gene_type:complete